MGRSMRMSLLLLPLTGLIFAVTAWTYCLRGWLVSLMSNPRKRRTVIAVVTFTFVIIAQLPNAFNFMAHSHRVRPSQPRVIHPDTPPAENQAPASVRNALPKALRIAHQTVPFFWIGQGAQALALGQIWPVLWRAVVLFALGGLGLYKAYSTTLRFYLGQTNKRPLKTRTRKQSVPPSERATWLERSIPGLPEDATVLALASLRSMTRAPEIKTQLAIQTLMLLFFGAMALAKHTGSLAQSTKPFLASGVVLFTFFSLSRLMFNQFGFDRNGFRSYLLWPTPRDHILLGKNLSFLPIALAIGITFLAILTLSRMLSVPLILCSLVQLLAAFLLVSTIANVTSILIPYRIGHGSLKPTKTRPLTTVLLVLSSLLLPFLMSPILLIPFAVYELNKAGWITPPLSNPLLSVILLGLSVLCYKCTLTPLGRLLQRRQQYILEVVTHEVE